MTEAFVVRLAHVRDAHVLSVMSRDLIEAGLGWRYGPQQLMRLIADPDTIAIVATRRQQVLGFAVLHLGDERAHLVLLAVQRSQQRRGIGRRLVDWLIASATVAGMSAIDLELRAGNAPARAFYRAQGFTDTRLIDGYYGGRESALRMERRLRVPVAQVHEWRPPTLRPFRPPARRMW